MPSGSKRKKKSKKSTAAAGPVVIPNSKNQENVDEKVLVVAEKENEVFETPKSLLDPEDNEVVDSREAARNETDCDVIEKEVILEKIESTAKEHVDVVDEEKRPAVQIDEVEASSLDEKEIEGGLQQEEMANVKNGDANVRSKFSSSKSIDLEMMLDDGLKSGLENRAIENEQILLVSAIPNVVECSQEIPGQIDEDLSRSNEDIHENSDSLVAAKEAEKSSSDKTSPADKGKTEISKRTEVAYGPTIRRRTTFWNCCGLFDLIASSDR